MTKRGISRRGFLKGAAAGVAASAVAAPTVIASTALGRGGVPPASERVTLAHIGVGGQGSGLLNGFLHLEDAQSVATCDPFKDRREECARQVDDFYARRNGEGAYKGCAAYNDFREVLARDDVDAVIVATPDHWHAPIALAAACAGKDMYVEKPLGLSIEQNKALREAVHRYGVVFQYGTQQRCFSTHCAFACELVRNGRIGEIQAVRVIAPNGVTGGSTTPEPAPEGFDYDLWLGPAPVVPYTRDRCIGTGRWFVYDYAIGFIAGWGAHPLDIAHWGYPHTPVEYEGTGRIPTEGLFDTVVDWDVWGRYAGGVEFTLKAGGDLTTFVGTEGWVAASRGGIDADPKSLLESVIGPGEIHLLQNNNHYRNFLDSVLARTDPASPIDSAVQSDFMSHLGDIAIRTGRKIRWNPEREEIVGDAEASRMMTRPMRSPWRL